ncbi:hypothetical protein B0H14DRAFT_2673354 [Mycena olivaceomarginata]|nr:hypothetical protein B0H14DRAFT_2673354 [Mycena olivaceomarginata]
MEFVQNLDPGKLSLGLAVLAFVLSPFAVPPYNLPIMLFGTVAVHLQESSEQPLQLFAGLLGSSAIFDIIWISQNEQNGFIKFLTFVLLLVKIPAFIAFGLALRQRGGNFAGLGIRGGDLSGATVWDSMPGGFGGGGGYQNVDERPPQFSGPTGPPSMPVPQPPGTQAPAAPGAYQTV